jgi:hypothetical protein
LEGSTDSAANREDSEAAGSEADPIRTMQLPNPDKGSEEEKLKTQPIRMDPREIWLLEDIKR